MQVQGGTRPDGRLQGAPTALCLMGFKGEQYRPDRDETTERFTQPIEVQYLMRLTNPLAKTFREMFAL